MQQILTIITSLFHKSLGFEFLPSYALVVSPVPDPKGLLVFELHDLMLTALLHSPSDHAYDKDVMC